MPDNTPLTQTPYALLADAPNIESAVPPGFKHLEKYVIPRFSTTSERNAAFNESAPSVGQMCYVSSLGAFGYLVWDGDSWVEFGDYTHRRTRTVFVTASQDSTSTLFRNVDDLSLPVLSGAIYKVECSFVYGIEDDADIEFNFIFPNASSRITMTPAGKSQIDSSSTTSVGTMNMNTVADRTSGNSPLPFAGPSLNNAMGSLAFGVLRSEGGGELQVQFRRIPGTGSSGSTVRCVKDSYLSLTRLS